MTTEKISIEDASAMSLDDYISAAGIKAPVVARKDRSRNKNRNSDAMDIDDTIPDASSLQWRLKDPNRPVGMAPLIPFNARQKEYVVGNNQYRNRRNFDKPYADRDKPLNGVNRNNQRKFKNNGMRSNAKFQAGLCNAAHAQGICNALMAYPNNTVATMSQISENVVGLVAPLIANSNFENVFAKMLEKWEQKKIQAPKYNMALQKEISEVQGKTLTFTCTSGLATPTVVTQDGFGVDDCEVNPVTTDMSMHQRFA